MSELFFEGILALVFLAFLILGGQIPNMSSPNDFVEAKGFPIVFATIGLLLLALEMSGKFRRIWRNKSAEEKAPKTRWKQYLKIAAVVAMTIGYILFAKYTGFVLFAVVFAFLALNLLGSKNQVFNLIFSIVAVLLLTLIFGRFFGIILPRGQGILKALSFYLY